VAERKPVIIESPYAGCVALHEAYLQACIRDCLRRNETPYASHQMLTKALNDLVPEERELGISAGLAMRDLLGTMLDALSAFYVDLNWSSGMNRARENVGMWDVRTIESEDEWERISREACEADPLFASLLLNLEATGLTTREYLLLARNAYMNLGCARG
jgi:hypothetical protein